MGARGLDVHHRVPATFTVAGRPDGTGRSSSREWKSTRPRGVLRFDSSVTVHPNVSIDQLGWLFDAQFSFNGIFVFCSGERLLVRFPSGCTQTMVPGPGELSRHSCCSLRCPCARGPPRFSSPAILSAAPTFHSDD